MANKKAQKSVMTLEIKVKKYEMVLEHDEAVLLNGILNSFYSPFVMGKDGSTMYNGLKNAAPQSVLGDVDFDELAERLSKKHAASLHGVGWCPDPTCEYKTKTS